MQTSKTFHDYESAIQFGDLVDTLGPAKAEEIHGVNHDKSRGITVAEWAQHHIDHLTSVKQYAIDKYRAYLRNDIGPAFGSVPLAHLEWDHISLWIRATEAEGAKPGTVGNKHGFLSGALAAAVPKRIAVNPVAAQRRRLPQGDGDDHEPVFLSCTAGSSPSIPAGTRSVKDDPVLTRIPKLLA